MILNAIHFNNKFKALYKMKKIFLMAAAALALFGCTKTEKKPLEIEDRISIAPQVKTVSHEGGAAVVLVSSSSDWTLEAKADYSSWLTSSATSGKDGDKVTFTVNKNTSGEQKNASFVFKCGKAQAEYTLHSLPLEVEPLYMNLVSDANVVLGYKDGGNVEILLTSSLGYREINHEIQWEGDAPSGDDAWLEYRANLEGDTDNGVKIVFSYKKLTAYSDRNATIVLSGEGVDPVSVKIVQEAEKVLFTTGTAFTAELKGGDLIIPLTANVKYSVSVSNEGEGWITDGGAAEGGHKLSVAALTSGKRSATVTFTQTDAKEGETPLKASVTVSQMNLIIKYAARMKGNRLFPKWEGFKPGISSKFTLEALVKFDEFPNNKLIATIMGIEGKFLLRTGDTGNTLDKLQIATSNGNYVVPEKLKANEWYHIAVTFDQGNVVVYYNGKEVGKKYFDGGWYGALTNVNLSPTWSYEPHGNRCFWVGYSYESNRDFPGLMTEVRIWKKALTEAEINAENHFYTVAPNSDKLFSYWKFTAGSGDTIDDATTRGNKLYGELNVRKQGQDNKGDAGIEWVEVALPDK